MKGQCYYRCLMALFEEHFFGAKNLRLCHGYPRLTRPDGGYPVGTLYGHAWIEGQIGEIEVCFNFDPDGAILKELYYATGKIDEALVTRYAATEAFMLAEVHGTPGPWGETHPEAKFADD